MLLQKWLTVITIVVASCYYKSGWSCITIVVSITKVVDGYYNCGNLYYKSGRVLLQLWRPITIVVNYYKSGPNRAVPEALVMVYERAKLTIGPEFLLGSR